jgi:hypothetical protein
MKRTALFAWTLTGLIIFSLILRSIRLLENVSTLPDILAQIPQHIWLIVLPAFGFLAALIVSRQPRNIVGWLLFVPAAAGIFDVEHYIRSFSPPIENPPLWLYLAILYNGAGWLLLIFPLFFIPVLFPTGQPPSPHWRWLIRFGLGMCAIFLFLVIFSRTYRPVDIGPDWSIENPIGFIPEAAFGDTFITLWGLGLILLAVLSATSLFVRYRHAAAQERAQIKWLLFACTIFALSYIGSFPIQANMSGTLWNDITNVIWSLSLIGIPISIAIAILRYRVWDIDLVIRRTLVYTVFTALLGLVYLGLVTLLQRLFAGASGQQSPLALVVSTLAIAALFNPLRRRVQNEIDRHFYRKKYNAVLALEEFSDTIRREVSLDTLATQMVGVVEKTMQPEQVFLWLRKTAKP